MTKPVKPTADRIIKSGVVSTPRVPKKATSSKGKLVFFSQWCKKCGLCTVVCPNEALEQDKDGVAFLKDSDKCVLCSICWRICPDYVISKNPENDGETKINDK